MVDKKVLPCWLFDDVLCSFRRSEKVKLMDRCLTCREYARFEREMDEADDKLMDEIDAERRAMGERV